MKNSWLNGVKVLAVAVFSVVLLTPALASAALPECKGVSGEKPGETCKTNLTITKGMESAKGSDVPTDLTGDSGIFKTIVNVILFVVGAVAVIMIIIGGVRYVVSGGDQNNVKAAKDTILYAVIGLIIAILAYAVVNFIVLNVK